MNKDFDNHKIGRRSFVAGSAVAATGLASLALVGCGDDDQPSSGQPVAGSSTVAGKARPEPKRGGKLTFSVFGDPPNLDIHANTSVVAYYPLAQIYNQLVRFDPAAKVQSPDAIVPDLARNWEITADGLQYTFNLKPGVKFHNGKPFTSADVKASLQRIANPPTGVVSPRKLQFATIDSIDTPSESVVTIKLKRPTSAFLTFLASGWVGMYSADDIGSAFDFNTKTNGTGPFVLKQYSKGNRFELDANPSYFDTGKPYLAGLSGFVIPDSAAAMASFQSGDLLLWRGPSPSQRKVVKDALGDKMTVVTNPANGIWGLNFGPGAPWRDPRVRQALTLAVDRESAIQILNEGEGDRGGYLPPHGFWKLPEAKLKAVPGYGESGSAGRAEAQRLLSAAGVASNVTVSILTRQGQAFETFSAFVQDQLKQLGFNAQIKIAETAAFNDALNKRSFDIAPVQQGYALEDPDAIFAESFLTGAPRNYSDVGSAEVDALFARQSQSLDTQERLKLVNEMEEKALALYGKTVLHWYLGSTAWRSNVQGYLQHTGSQIGERYDAVWLNS